MTPSMVRIAILAAVAAQALLAVPCFGDEADDWNALAERVSAQDSPSPAAALQAQSTVRCAVEAALERGASLGRPDAAELAAGVAAHDVLSRLYPARRAELDLRLKQQAAAVPRGAPIAEAAQYGRMAAAQAMLVSWPERLREDGKGPRGLDPGVGVPLPGRDDPSIIEPARQRVRPLWRDRHAIQL